MRRKQKSKTLIALSNPVKQLIFTHMGWTAIDKGMLEMATQQFSQAQQSAVRDIDKQSAQQGLNSVTGIKLQRALSLRDDNAGAVSQI